MGKNTGAPKRPMSAYLLFCQEKREETKKENPDLKVTELSKKLADKWKALDDDEKIPYNEKAQKLKDSYKKEKEKYDASNPAPAPAKRKRRAKKDESEESEDEDEEDNKRKKKQKKKRKAKDPNAPKRPLSAYMLFCQDKREGMKKEFPSLKITELSRKFADKWKEMDDDDKAPYNEKAKKLKEAYTKVKEEYDKGGEDNNNEEEEEEEEEDDE